MPSTPWDIYIDERKTPPHALGFLAVPNSPSFMHKLYMSRYVVTPAGTVFRPHEVHWNEPRLDLLEVQKQWIYLVFQHHGAKFYKMDWPKGSTKEYVILKFMERFCGRKKLVAPYNIVVFLDFDNAHASSDIQNNIRQFGNIARCYHLDSKNNDCLQCCDLLLGALTTLQNDPTIRFRHLELHNIVEKGEKLRDSQVKRYLAGHLGSLIDGRNGSIVDLSKKQPKK